MISGAYRQGPNARTAGAVVSTAPRTGSRLSTSRDRAAWGFQVVWLWPVRVLGSPLFLKVEGRPALKPLEPYPCALEFLLRLPLAFCEWPRDVAESSTNSLSQQE